MTMRLKASTDCTPGRLTMSSMYMGLRVVGAVGLTDVVDGAIGVLLTGVRLVLQE